MNLGLTKFGCIMQKKSPEIYLVAFLNIMGVPIRPYRKFKIVPLPVVIISRFNYSSILLYFHFKASFCQMRLLHFIQLNWFFDPVCCNFTLTNF
jgi:hypothetical protein